MEVATFKLRLTGGLADRHEIEAYNGYTSLAGAAWTLSLVTNYVETGTIRHRGNFPARHAVHALPMREGSILAEFSVLLASSPAAVFGTAAVGASASAVLYGVLNRVLNRNIGFPNSPLNQETSALLKRKDGDVETLVAITEPSVRQAHEVIGNGAEQIEWIGGHSVMTNFNRGTKEYVRANIPDLTLIEKDVTISGFYANTGNGSIYDPDLHRNVPVSMTSETLRILGTVFSWGLDQFTNKTGKKVRVKFTRILAMDGRPKRYIIVHAKPARGS